MSIATKRKIIVDGSGRFLATNPGPSDRDAHRHKETCEHTRKIYQPEENDTNIPESYTCDDCGVDLEIPDEPDWYLFKKEEEE